MAETATLDIRVLGIPEVTQMQRERDELLAALKEAVDAWETVDQLNWEERGTGPYEIPPEMAATRALIARIEKPVPPGIEKP